MHIIAVSGSKNIEPNIENMRLCVSVICGILKLFSYDSLKQNLIGCKRAGYSLQESP